MSQKVLITGINGFIGSNLASTLKRSGFAVVGLDMGPRFATCDDYFEGSVLDAELVQKAVQGSQAVFHLAALTAHSDIVDNKYQTLSINLQGTSNVLQALAASGVDRFIYTSTGKVYGSIESLPITEDHPTRPLNVLGKSKLITERLIDFFDDGNRKLFVFRIFNVFGEGQKSNFLLPTILQQIDAQRTSSHIAIRLGDIKAKRDYIYIGDVIGALVQALRIEPETSFEVFNLCSGIPRSAGEIVDMIAAIVDKPVDVKVNEALFRADEMDVEYGSFDKAARQLAWKPSVDIRDWLQKTLK